MSYDGPDEKIRSHTTRRNDRKRMRKYLKTKDDKRYFALVARVGWSGGQK